MISSVEIILRLVLGGLLGGLVGFEREQHNRPAGFRTHILVCVGATLIMLVSIYTFIGPEGEISRGADTARIAAQVVSGVGFLGAGTILRQGSTIKGLTTAASLWVVAGIGLAVGGGFYLGAITATSVVMISLYLLGNVERYLARRKRVRELWVRVVDRPGQLANISYVIANREININKVEMNGPEFLESYQTDALRVTFLLKLPAKFDDNEFITSIMEIDGVLEVNWEGDFFENGGSNDDITG
ncbi:MgtC/SapB family protein [Natranaerobius trueperi]|uniref:Magnesium transporter MgtC n=1 Tax=Natranaerobius trueperi TaxID=759412 RepID=A0A226C0G1_9FIRM|nr:MgtC/SapB family protein [Natranaerobius trueperi]OWZ84532.1 magnesium transporter MgtC [Natranaerobius trueperi]